ncbi:MAG TPA: nucleoside triphosphate pyrophosphohydrolase, partial [Gemmatimonadaceae bacterium]|nr:nucleoside triphosphate pyrophosphohydrolase [Gemmatimonadaceae bacterium]
MQENDVPAPAPAAPSTSAPTLEDALALMRDLRARCSWDAAQTHESLRPYLLEEAHELDDAIRAGDDRQMREELGDVLLQVLFHSVVAEERGAFDANGVADALITKMKARHPHLYGDGARVPWERQKARRRRSIVDGLPVDLPPLHRAHRLQDRAAGVGFDWPDAAGPAAKVAEELEEVRAHLPAAATRVAAASADAPVYDAAHEALEAELGDLLFSCVNLCRKVGVHAAPALDRANRKFADRFERVEQLAAERGIVVGEATLEELDGLWDEVKTRE